MTKKLPIFFTLLFLLTALLHAQQQDSTYNKKFSLHAQTTVIPQYHFNFNSPYQGQNSLLPSEPVRTSVTATLYAAYKPFAHTYFVFDPEVGAGKGLSRTLGIAGFPNGEVYRVGNPAPHPYIARLYVEQRFPISRDMESIDDDQNQIREKTNSDYLSIFLGKFSLTDIFGNADFSHDPRTQFLNWSLMGHGAWDYPANTRGYTIGAIVQLQTKNWVFSYANVAEPTVANGPDLEWKGSQVMGEVWEVEKDSMFYKNPTHFSTLRAGAFLNLAHMGNYEQAIQQDSVGVAPDVTKTGAFGRSKYGYYIGFDNTMGYFHPFLRTSWNDGHNESWAFTEIDASTAVGVQIDGNIWYRNNDKIGAAYVQNNISNWHREYLEKGGYGFIIGDGALTYGPEQIFEFYYSLNIWHFFVSPDYQFVINPAYNRARGPVHIVALRVHFAI